MISNRELFASMTLEPLSDCKEPETMSMAEQRRQYEETEKQMSNTRRVIHCMKRALSRSMSLQQMRESIRPLDPATDFSLVTRVKFDGSHTKRDAPVIGGGCCASAAVRGDEQLDSRFEMEGDGTLRPMRRNNIFDTADSKKGKKVMMMKRSQSAAGGSANPSSSNGGGADAGAGGGGGGGSASSGGAAAAAVGASGGTANNNSGAAAGASSVAGDGGDRQQRDAAGSRSGNSSGKQLPVMIASPVRLVDVPSQQQRAGGGMDNASAAAAASHGHHQHHQHHHIVHDTDSGSSDSDSSDDDDDDDDLEKTGRDFAQSPSFAHVDPANSIPFEFTDFSPMCFRHIRSFMGIEPDSFLKVLCESNWHSIPTPGKSSAQLYFCGQNWVIKTMTESESDFLRRILHRYYYHVRDNPHTLLPHFVGHHKLAFKDVDGTDVEFTFVIMQNVFATPLKIHRKFDLKGSTVGRFATAAEKKKTTCTEKDLDINKPLRLGEPRRAVLIEQMRRDCDFLRRSEIMDYSFLIGIHRIQPQQQQAGQQQQQQSSGAASAGGGQQQQDQQQQQMSATQRLEETSGGGGATVNNLFVTTNNSIAGGASTLSHTASVVLGASTASSVAAAATGAPSSSVAGGGENTSVQRRRRGQSRGPVSAVPLSAIPSSTLEAAGGGSSSGGPSSSSVAHLDPNTLLSLGGTVGGGGGGGDGGTDTPPPQQHLHLHHHPSFNTKLHRIEHTASSLSAGGSSSAATGAHGGGGGGGATGGSAAAGGGSGVASSSNLLNSTSAMAATGFSGGGATINNLASTTGISGSTINNNNMTISSATATTVNPLASTTLYEAELTGGDMGLSPVWFGDERCFTADSGGMLSTMRDEIYYIGIIDILQEYNWWKRAETFFMGTVHDRSHISSVDPRTYAGRFFNFMDSIII